MRKSEMSEMNSKVKTTKKQEVSSNKGNTPVKNTSKISKQSGNSLKEREKKRKQIFKPVLDSTLTQANWPFIKPELANSILEALEIVLKSVKGDQELLGKITVGFNETTGNLEQLAMHGIRKAIPVKYVFICKNDISNSLLTQHFPVLTFTASKRVKTSIKLVQLPKGSSQRISQALGKENTTILGIPSDLEVHEGLFNLFEQVGDISVPFLEGIFNNEMHFNEPLINMVATTAPIVSKSDNKQKGKANKKQNK